MQVRCVKELQRGTKNRELLKSDRNYFGGTGELNSNRAALNDRES